MILFYGLPPQIYPHGGMMRRIAHIDSLFSVDERIYCYPYQYSGIPVDVTPRIEKITQRVSFFPICFNTPTHNELFVTLLRKSDFLYAHTVHSGQFLYPYYDSGKIITDLHGIAPEEEEMLGYENRARFYAAYERTLIQKSYRVIGVTQSMFLHYQEKYGLSAERFIYFPIASNIEPCECKNRSNATRIIYSGGVQTWQQVPKMLDVVKQLVPMFEFLFLTTHEAELRQMAQEKGVASLMRIESCQESALPRYYAWADYGFCLRENSPVNRVACPTKLMEYAACGIVPIIESDRVGDFFDLGGKAVSLEDMLHGHYPSQENLEIIRNANYTVIERLSGNVRYAEAALRNIQLPVSPLSDAEWEFRFLTTESRTVFFPAVGRWQYGDMTRDEPDICSLCHELTFPLPLTREDNADIVYSLSPIPILLDTPYAFAVYANGRKKKIPFVHNFVKRNGKLLALSGNNNITINSVYLNKAVSVVITIRILTFLGDSFFSAFVSQVFPRILWLRRLADKLFPTGTKRRKQVKKMFSYLRNTGK